MSSVMVSLVRKQIYTAKKKRWSQRRYADRFRSGLCPMCGGKRTGEWIVCIDCREKSKVRSRIRTPESKNKATNKYRANCRKQGICYGCGSYIGLGKYKRCASCRERDRDAHMRRYISSVLAG